MDNTTYRKLEDFRSERLGRVAIHHQDIPALFHDLSTMAFKFTLASLEHLENPNGDILIRSPYDRVTLITWFDVLESFISTILHVVSDLKGVPYNNEKIGKKIYAILELAKIDSIDFKQKTKIITKIDEFCQVRNALHHGNKITKKVSIRHTKFHDVPFYLNQIDVIQSLIICIEFFKIFSNLFVNVNLMPQITIPMGASYDHFGLDYLYENLIKPYFKWCLEKHNLTTDLSLESTTIVALEDQFPEVKVFIKISNNTDPIQKLNKTNISQMFYHKMVNQHFEGKTEQLNKLIRGEIFTIPDYTRKKNHPYTEQ